VAVRYSPAEVAGSERFFGQWGSTLKIGDRSARVIEFSIDLQTPRWRTDTVGLVVAGIDDRELLSPSSLRWWPPGSATGRTPTAGTSTGPTMIEVCDGDCRRVHWVHYGSGRFERVKPELALKQRATTSLVLCSSGLQDSSGSFSQTVEEWGGTTKVSHEVMDGEDCLRLSASPSSAEYQIQHVLWVAPQKGYAVVRFAARLQARTGTPPDGSLAFETRYGKFTRTPSGLWLPQEAVRERYAYAAGGGDGWRSTQLVRFKRLEVNVPLPAETFYYRFPIGTSLTDGEPTDDEVRANFSPWGELSKVPFDTLEPDKADPLRRSPVPVPEAK